MPTVQIPDALRERINAASVSVDATTYRLRFVSATVTTRADDTGADPAGSIVEIAATIGQGENPQVIVLSLLPSRIRDDHDTIVNWLQHRAFETLAGRALPGHREYL
jgi:hypothetical protein